MGADLHDGPAQLIAFALLKLEELTSEANSEKDRLAVGQSIKEPLQDALTEIRNLSGGLTLPGFEGLTTREVLDKAANSHRRRTDVQIHREFDQALSQTYLPESVLICVYRFVQETLNNSFQHGQTEEVFLSANLSEHSFTATVLDHGVGFNPDLIDRETHCLGLAGMRERIESVGGTFSIISQLGEGTRACASFSLDTQHEE